MCLALTACGTDPAAKVAAPACSLDRAADLPMAPGTSYAVVPARIDGQAVSMLLDTGDERLTIRPGAQRTLRLPIDPHHSTRVRGIGGDSVSFDAILQRLELGDTEIPQSGAAIADFPLFANTNPPLAGILGAQIMSDYEVEFNFASRHVVFWQRTGCTNVAPDWPAPYAARPLARGARNLVTLEVMIDGHPIRALLDTGAQNTILGFDAATRLGITAESRAGSRVPVFRGADGSDVFTRVAHVSDIALGGAHRKNATILVAPLHLQYADMLLGVDFLQHRDLWISYGGQIAFIR